MAGIGPINDRYIDAATELGEQALGEALKLAGLAPTDLDLLIVTSVTGVVVPSLDARLIPRLGLRPDVKRLPVFGLGCVAGAAALSRMHDYLVGYPDHHAALLAVEVCSLNWPFGDITTADLVASGLFADGAAAVVATGGDRGAGPRDAPEPEPEPARMPAVVATRSAVYPDSEGALGWRLGSDGFRMVLTTGLADVVENNINLSVTSFLAEHGLTVDDVDSWICHPGGPRVLDAVREGLGLSDEALELSRRSLADVGNLSSVSVLHILEQTAELRPPAPGSIGVMIGLGPGVSAELLLLRW